MAKNEWENDEAFLKGAAVFHDFPMTFPNNVSHLVCLTSE